MLRNFVTETNKQTNPPIQTFGKVPVSQSGDNEAEFLLIVPVIFCLLLCHKQTFKGIGQVLARIRNRIEKAWLGSGIGSE